ncbi:hypothetical protein V6W80_11220 [Pseudomonas benzopyrenica]|uniref:Uncharacterized protein n=1 Tax=Pseudomonas benzopyrenica TaxID=2993566 RepID=A0ABZ2FYZ5_9PSED
MNSSALISELRTRMNINYLQYILRGAGIPTARSWAQLGMILEQAINKDPRLYSRLADALKDLAVNDMKSVAYFSVTSSVGQVLADGLKNLKISSSGLAKKYPLMASSEELSSATEKYEIVDVFSDEFGVGCVLSRRRRFEVSEEYTRENFSSDLPERFKEYDKFVATKYVSRQTFDVIYYDVGLNVLQLRADVMRGSAVLQTVQQQRKSNEDLRTFSGVVFGATVYNSGIGLPLNLLPLIKNIYSDPSGAIKKLGFRTESDSVKHETMQGGRDLRTEEFHLNGAKAIDHKIMPFEISIIWHRKDIDGTDSIPELFIPGSCREAMKLGARYDHAIVRGIKYASDNRFVTQKILTLMPKNEHRPSA